MLTDNTRKYLLGVKGYITKSNTCLHATVLKMFTGVRKKTGNELAAGCQLFYRKVYRYIFLAVYVCTICMCNRRNVQNLLPGLLSVYIYAKKPFSDSLKKIAGNYARPTQPGPIR